MCPAALPQLASQERLRAIRAHISEHHPEETMRTIFHKNYRGRPKPPGFHRHLQQRFQQNKASLFPTHDLVVVPYRPDPTNKPSLYWHKTFCKNCFGKFTGKSCTKLMSLVRLDNKNCLTTVLLFHVNVVGGITSRFQTLTRSRSFSKPANSPKLRLTFVLKFHLKPQISSKMETKTH